MFKFLLDKKNRHFMQLFWAQMISQFGDRIHQMALIGLIAERAPGSAWGLAKLLSFTIFPVFIIGPIAGVLVDRWDRRRTLFMCDLIRGLLVLLVPLVLLKSTSMLPIYVVVFLIFCFSRFYVPAKMSILPDLVPQKHLLMANSLMTTTGMIAFVVGCVLGGFMVDWWGARGGFYCDAVTFLVSGLMIFMIPKNVRELFRKETLQKTSHEIQEMIQMEKSFFSEIKEGVLYLFRRSEIRFVIQMLFVLLAAAGAIYVVIIIFIQQTFHSVTKDLGVLAVFLGIGLFLGSLSYGRWGKRFSWYKTIFFCLVAGGIMMMLFAISLTYYPNLIFAAGLSLVLGMIIGPIFIASNTIVHLVSDEKMRGKVFSALEVVIHFAFLLAMLASSFINRYVDAVWILTGVGGIFAVVGCAGFIQAQRGKLGLVKEARG